MDVLGSTQFDIVFMFLSLSCFLSCWEVLRCVCVV